MKTILLLFLATMLAAASCKKHYVEPVKKPVAEECYHPLTYLGVTYSVHPCIISDTITRGQGDVPFTLTISTDTPVYYGFTVYGYGAGLPTYGIIANEMSGGAYSDQVIHLHFSDRVLEPGQYKAYLPIKISDNYGDYADSTLNLKVRLLVK